jgi:hypothetical protein
MAIRDSDLELSKDDADRVGVVTVGRRLRRNSHTETELASPRAQHSPVPGRGDGPFCL